MRARPFYTDYYKRFRYPSRAWFSLGLAGVFGLLFYFGPIPLVWMALGVACCFSDDIPMTPVMSIVTAVNNLWHQRKSVKAIVTLVVVGLAVLAGALLGVLVFAQMPLATAFLASYLVATYSSPLLMALGAILGGLFAHTTRKLSAFWGVTLGLVIGSLLPIALPISVEVVYLSVALCAFMASVLTKQALRLYFYCRYGATNADGYAVDRAPAQQQAFIDRRAREFNVTPAVLTQLLTSCRARVAESKAQASLWHEHTGQRRAVSNSYKDIYHALMKPHLSAQERQAVKRMIAGSHLKRHADTATHQKRVNYALGSGHLFQVGHRERMLVHQFQVAEGGGLNQRLLRAFAA